MPKFFNPTLEGQGRAEFLGFWHNLQSSPGASAALRRAWSPVDVLLVDRFHDLRARLAAKDIAYDVASLAVAAAVVARVRNDGAVFGRACAKAGVSSRRLMSALAAEEHADVLTALARLLPLLTQGVDVADVGRLAYQLSHPSLRERAIADVAEQFYLTSAA